jgi:hypothetical protein
MAIFIKLEAQKALYSLYKQILILIFQLKLFDALVYPILTYSAEIWGFENKNIIEKNHLQFCRKILGVRTSTHNFMVYGELGRYPIELQIKIKMLCFWNKIVGNHDKLSGKIYRLLFKLCISGKKDIPWMNYIKSIFDETGFSNIWDGQKYINPEFLKATIK